MGLDFVEITMEIEKTFGIAFTPEDFLDLQESSDLTAGQLYDVVLGKLHLRDFGRHDIGLNFQFWRSMRSVLVNALEVPSEDIRLESALEELFPVKARRAAWTSMAALCPWRIPELDYPRFVSVLGLSVAGLMVAIEQFQIWQIPGLNGLWPVLGFIGLWMFIETYTKLLSICSSWRNRIPPNLKSVKDLCRTVFAVNYHSICETAGLSVTDECPEIWDQLVSILSETLGVDRSHITFRSRLIFDLGLS